MRVTETVLARVLSRVRYDAGCWEYTGSRWSGGYGHSATGTGKTAGTHRILYETLVAEVPVGMEVDHLCRNRACCNPLHLEVVSRAENVRRAAETAPAWQRSKTTCPRGHPLDGVYVRKDGGKSRYCKACRRKGGRS